MLELQFSPRGVILILAQFCLVLAAHDRKEWSVCLVGQAQFLGTVSLPLNLLSPLKLVGTNDTRIMLYGEGKIIIQIDPTTLHNYQ